MRLAHTVEDVRAAEAAAMAGLPDGTLMARASAGLATVGAGLLGHVYGARVVLLVGSGGNGGDALYAGAALARRGARVDAVLLGSAVHERGLAALRRAGGRVAAEPGEAIDAADLVVDGVVGIGGRGGLRDDAARQVRRAEASPAHVVAVDVPSGVDAATGEVRGAALHADVTVTFGTLKPGLLVDPGASHAGLVELVDIGLSPHLGPAGVSVLDAGDVAALLPVPDAASDKYSRGVVGVVAGSERYPGAAVLSAGGALRGGAGMVRYVGPDAVAALVHQHWPEVVLGVGRVQAWVAGPGIGTDDRSRERLDTALGSAEPVVVDADGTTLLAGRGRLDRAAPTLLTPHAGELARLLGVERPEVEARRLDSARRAAEGYGATVLLKGSTTVVAAPDGRVRVTPTAPAWLATAGSGDVLAGLAAALLGGGLEVLDAASLAAWVHAAAAGLAAGAGGGGPVTAYDVGEALPQVWREGG